MREQDGIYIYDGICCGLRYLQHPSDRPKDRNTLKEALTQRINQAEEQGYWNRDL
jgi:hypothetical protein